jgi:hypothetical protein
VFGTGEKRWLLDVKKRPIGERVQELTHIGLRSYLGKCDDCFGIDLFTLKPDREDGIIRFVGKDCGRVVGPICSSVLASLFTDTDLLDRNSEPRGWRRDIRPRPFVLRCVIWKNHLRYYNKNSPHYTSFYNPPQELNLKR